MKIVRREYTGSILYGYYDECDRFIYHNDGSPSIINKINNERKWLQHGVYHREDGPAIVHEDGVVWLIHGKIITHEVNQWLEKHNIGDWQTMTEEDKLALSFFMRSL